MRRSVDESAFWISYSDLSTGLLLIFILLLTQMSKTKQSEEQRLVNLREEVAHLLGVHERLSSRLGAAVEQTNQKLGKNIFKFAEGEVYVSDQEVTWFKSNSAKLLPDARDQLRMFYLNLYDALLRDEAGDLTVETHLVSMTIEGHTDPLPIRSSDQPWSLASYNGSSRTGHNKDSNFQLGQQRAKAIIDLIHDSYTEQLPGFDHTRPWHVFFAFAQASGRSWTRAYCQERDDLSAGISTSTSARISAHPLTPTKLIAAWPTPCPRIEHDSDAIANRRSRRVTFSFELNTRSLLENLRSKLDSASSTRGQ